MLPSGVNDTWNYLIVKTKIVKWTTLIYIFCASRQYYNYALILFLSCRQLQTAWHKTWHQFQPMRKKNQWKPTNHIAAYMKRFVLLVNMFECRGWSKAKLNIQFTSHVYYSNFEIIIYNANRERYIIV